MTPLVESVLLGHLEHAEACLGECLSRLGVVAALLCMPRDTAQRHKINDLRAQLVFRVEDLKEYADDIRVVLTREKVTV